MKSAVLIITLFNIVFFVVHELSLIKHDEWKMFKFIKRFKERKQKLIFLYLHLPLPSLLIFYLYAVFIYSIYEVFIVVNILAIIYFITQLLLLKDLSSKYKTATSAISISGLAFTSALNLYFYPFFIV